MNSSSTISRAVGAVLCHTTSLSALGGNTVHHVEENSPFKKVLPESSILRETIPYAFPTVALQVPSRGLQGNDDVSKHLCILYVLCTRGMILS
jgi:hypothetical protein